MKILYQELTRFKKLLPQNCDQKFLERAEYLIIKSRQLLIIDNRINKSIDRFYRDFYRKKDCREVKYQALLSELYLDTETFFYVAARLVDLLFEGMKGIVKITKDEKTKFDRIMIIRNQLLEHSHKPGQPIENEICQFGLNKSYGVYVRSAKGADKGRPYRDRAYYPLRHNLVKDLVNVLKEVRQ